MRADSLRPHDLLSCGQKWLTALTLFFTENERKHAGCQHRLFSSQVEYLGQPTKITTIFGRKVTKRYQGKLQTIIEDLNLPNPVIRTHCPGSAWPEPAESRQAGRNPGPPGTHFGQPLPPSTRCRFEGFGWVVLGCLSSGPWTDWHRTNHGSRTHLFRA